MYLSSSTALPRARQQLATVPTRAQCIIKPVRHAGSGSTSQRIVEMAATPPGTGPQPAQQQPEGEFEGLLPEEDPEIPGNYFDAVTSTTKLGKAVKAAVQELEHLGNLESEVLTECDDLLKKLGMKGSLFGSGDNPLARLQQELAELEAMEEQELKAQAEQLEQQQKQQGNGSKTS